MAIVIRWYLHAIFWYRPIFLFHMWVFMRHNNNSKCWSFLWIYLRCSFYYFSSCNSNWFRLEGISWIFNSKIHRIFMFPKLLLIFNTLRSEKACWIYPRCNLFLLYVTLMCISNNVKSIRDKKTNIWDGFLRFLF